MKYKKLSTSLIVVCAFAILFATVTYNKQTIIDWARLRNYVPSAEIVSLANDSGMNDYGRRVFYVSHPELQNRSAFNESCSDSEQTIVLGCYIQNRGIFLYQVTDDRLEGIEEVTAAHEMLHAAYDRLSKKEKAHIDELIATAFASVKNERILKTVEAYRAKDASVVSNELHSILGTEVRDIPKELADYYDRYFEDRLVVVALSEAYESVFADVEKKTAELGKDLESRRTAIATAMKDLEKRANELNAEYQDLEKRRSTADPASFNIQVRRYNEDVITYNDDVQTVNGQIDEYEKLREEYNSIVVTQNELVEAIDSRPQSIQTD